MLSERDVASPLAGETISVTIDDFPYQHGLSLPPTERSLVVGIVSALERVFRRHPGATPLLFFNSDRVVDMPIPVERLAQIGLLGNHTASHCDIDSLPHDRWREDVLRCQNYMEPFLADRPRFFRFPFLRTGTSQSTKEAARSFLSDQGFITLPGGCPTADWLFAIQYEDATQAGDRLRCERIERAAVAHILSALQNAVFERAQSPLPSAPLTLVLHANRLLAGIIEPLLGAICDRGAMLVDAAATLCSFEHFNGFDGYLGTRGGSFFLRCSAAGRESLAEGRDWLSLQYAQIQAEFS